MASSDRPHDTTGGIDAENYVDCAAVAALDDDQQEAAREGLETFLADYRERHPTAAVPDNPTTTAVVEGIVAAIKQADSTIDVGDRRLDREREKEVIVVAIHDVDAEEYGVITTGKTVAEHNPQYPGEDRTIEAVYASSLPEWFKADPKRDLNQLAEENEGIARLHGIDTGTYAFPESRLAPVEGDEGE